MAGHTLRAWVNTLTFTGGRTNVVQGAVHLVLFLAFLALIFDP
jgi:Ca2+:H+ antiporter